LIKLSYKLIAFVLILYTCDLVVGRSFTYLLAKLSDGRYYKTQYSLDHANEDIIIIGSSRGETNYNPAVFTKVLSMSCWNASRGGQSLPYFLAIEQEILKRHSPKLIILNMEQNALEGEIDYEKSAFLRPFSQTHTFVYALLSQKNCLEKYRLFSNIYINNSILYYLIRPFFIKNKDGKQSDKGWKPRIGNISPSLVEKKVAIRAAVKKSELNQSKISILNKIIETATANNSKLVISFSPDYFPTPIETATMNYIKSFSHSKGITVYDFTKDITLNKKNGFFIDLEHMNQTGANTLSEMLSFKILNNNVNSYNQTPLYIKLKHLKLFNLTPKVKQLQQSILSSN
jgi:hypothetical protein